MEKSTEMGMNRTGIGMSPIDSKAMISGAQQLTPVEKPDGQAMMLMEQQFVENAGTIGSVPVPGTMKGALKAAMGKMAGRNPEALLNKMGERLAFERGGVRLYESAIRKCEALASLQGDAPVPLDELKHIRDEELEHFRLLKNCMTEMGADPTAVTPDADVSGVMALGIQKVPADPRTSIGQCLEALLVAELADNAAWELLISLSEQMGMDDMADDFRRALRQEETHVQRVRGWYEQAVMADATKEAAPRH
ncbi:MAG TPA: ferritin-like domain-containing protein [Gammaproteobacteria bacterium]